METTKQVTHRLSQLIAIGMLVAAIVLLATNPTIYVTQTWVLIHWFGLALLAMIICMKISAYCAVFQQPHKALVWMVIQFIALPFLIQILVNYFHLPFMVASAIAVSALSPGNIASNIVSNLFMAGCILLISWFVLPSTNQATNTAFEMTNSTVTKVVVIIAGLAVLLYTQFKKQKEEQPDVYVIKEVPRQKK